MIALVRQPAGLGDVLFTQKIYKFLQKKGYEVIWPIIDEFMWINEYLDVKFVSINENFPCKEYYSTNVPLQIVDSLIIPLQSADTLVSNCKIMESKYRIMNLDFSDWQDYLIIKRDEKKERELYYDVLSLKDDEEYCVILKNYGSPPRHAVYDKINYTGNLRTIEINFYENYTLFDWSKVLENASEIHIIDSSINYLIEKIKLKTVPYLYSRRGNNFSEIDYLFKSQYQFVIHD